MRNKNDETNLVAQCPEGLMGQLTHPKCFSWCDRLIYSRPSVLINCASSQELYQLLALHLPLVGDESSARRIHHDNGWKGLNAEPLADVRGQGPDLSKRVRGSQHSRNGRDRVRELELVMEADDSLPSLHLCLEPPIQQTGAELGDGREDIVGDKEEDGLGGHGARVHDRIACHVEDGLRKMRYLDAQAIIQKVVAVDHAHVHKT
mmetsp:Transcript_22880/g.74672  ORF Transcript_22880/g.74672 Transcript_22880/m.74672 type:complete len:205 (-) Transcript_22880:351-965(-)